MEKRTDFSPNPPPPIASREDLAREVRESIRQTVKNQARSIDQIAQGLSARLGREVTRTMIYAWTAESRAGHRFPLEWSAAWMRETNDWSLLWVLTDALGLPRMDSKDADLLAFGKKKLQAELLAAEAEGHKARILGDR